MRWHLLPYAPGSSSARALAHALGIMRIKGDKRLRRWDKVINWGSTTAAPFSRWGSLPVINSARAVGLAANKVAAFMALTRQGVMTVPWTTIASHAASWSQCGATVVARTLVNSSQGRGIVLVQPGTPMAHAPLYTKYIPRCHEYRVHVAFGKVIDYAKKRRSNGAEINEFIRSHDNGWVFCRENVSLPSIVESECKAAIAALGLDFGAVDVLYKEMDNRAWVLEVNTAPGLEGSTLTKYIEAFKQEMYG